jgi:hypothetical protein
VSAGAAIAGVGGAVAGGGADVEVPLGLIFLASGGCLAGGYSTILALLDCSGTGGAVAGGSATILLGADEVVWLEIALPAVSAIDGSTSAVIPITGQTSAVEPITGEAVAG